MLEACPNTLKIDAIKLMLEACPNSMLSFIDFLRTVSKKRAPKTKASKRPFTKTGNLP